MTINTRFHTNAITNHNKRLTIQANWFSEVRNHNPDEVTSQLPHINVPKIPARVKYTTAISAQTTNPIPIFHNNAHHEIVLGALTKRSNCFL
jgi:hypothetical protein|nr:hypothetical protein [bacterium]